MGTLPGKLLQDTITVEPYGGISPDGPLFGTPVTVRAHVQHKSKLGSSRFSDSGGSTNNTDRSVDTRTYSVWLRLGPTVPLGSRLTVRGDTVTATAVDINDGRNLPVPSHLELTCEQATFLPTTQVSITRGTPTADAFGDLVDSNTVVASAVPAAITEDAQTSYEPVDQRGGVIETVTVRLPHTADVREGDRLTDLAGLVYVVTDVTYSTSAVGPHLGTADPRAVCRRVAATSTPPT